MSGTPSVDGVKERRWMAVRAVSGLGMYADEKLHDCGGVVRRIGGTLYLHESRWL